MNSISVLFIGDIIGKPGLSFVQTWLPALKKEYKPDIIIANGENVNEGKGIVKSEGEILFQLGVDAITGGNHIWDKHQSQEYLKAEPRVLRPLNYPKGTHGNGMYLIQKDQLKVGVVNLQGSVRRRLAVEHHPAADMVAPAGLDGNPVADGAAILAVAHNAQALRARAPPFADADFVGVCGLRIADPAVGKTRIPNGFLERWVGDEIRRRLFSAGGGEGHSQRRYDVDRPDRHGLLLS